MRLSLKSVDKSIDSQHKKTQAFLSDGAIQQRPQMNLRLRHLTHCRLSQVVQNVLPRWLRTAEDS